MDFRWIKSFGLALLCAFPMLAKAESRTSTKLEKATFAGGCFWCMEPPFEDRKGVVSVTSGYCGGKEESPTYKQVSSGKTGHLETVQIIYNPAVIKYEALLEIFWRNIDPTDPNGQFVDQGKMYRSAIFYHDERQKKAAEASKKALEKSGRFKKKIVTAIRKATKFYPAEDYHQNYYKKNTVRYKYYRWNSGRDQFLDKIWGEDREKDLKDAL